MKIPYEVIAKNWPGQKGDEVIAVIRFYEHQNIQIPLTKENILTDQEEPTDVYVRSENKKFQVTWGNHSLVGGIGKAKPDKNGVKSFEQISYNAYADIWRRKVIEPIEKKKQFATSAKGITLLIWSPFAPTLVSKMAQIYRGTELNKQLQAHGWEEIILVSISENIHLYP